MTFDLFAQDPATKARAGRIETAHGTIETPIFMPVGTAGTVKAVSQHTLKADINAQIILGNTYHLYLRPGLDVLRAAGGLHKFNGWDRPILTDSGGYQVYSLSNTRKIKEEGVKFRSHIDGSQHLFSPEGVMDIQRVLTRYSAASAVFLHEWRHLSEPARTEFLALRDRYEGSFRQLIQHGIATGELHAPDAAFAALTLLASLNWLPAWYRPDGKLAPDEIAHRLAEQLLNGMRTED